ncbi:MAG: S8 family peptidase [candidate division WOR-3 bacterium]
MLFLTTLMVGLSSEANLYLEGRDNPSYWAEAVLGRGVVVYVAGTDLDAKAKDLEARGAKIVRINEIPGSIVFTIPEKTVEANRAFIDALLADPQVLYAEPDFKAYPHFTPNDPYWTSAYHWGTKDINADDAWDIAGLGSTSVKIAVVDQGVYYTHEDLAAAYGSVKGYDFVNDDNDPWPGPNEFHGTWTSGIAAARINNAIGMAGVSNSGLYALRALDQSGGTYTDIGDAIYWAANNGAHIISMSIGGPSSSAYLQSACQYAWNMGLYLAASSGNDGTNQISYPARYSTVVAVGAINQAHQRPSWSNYGPELELCAPGVSIIGCYGTNQYTYADGTSASCPFVTGAAGLVKAYKPSYTNQQIRDLLNATAHDYGAAGWDQYFGYGEVDLYAAIQGAGITEEELGVKFPVRATLSPSVSRGSASLLLTLGGLRDVAVSVYNPAGALVSVPFKGSLSGGEHSINLDLSGLPQGTYMVVVSDGYSSATQRLIKE